MDKVKRICKGCSSEVEVRPKPEPKTSFEKKQVYFICKKCGAKNLRDGTAKFLISPQGSPQGAPEGKPEKKDTKLPQGNPEGVPKKICKKRASRPKGAPEGESKQKEIKHAKDKREDSSVFPWW
jgi:hypothetical protein